MVYWIMVLTTVFLIVSSDACAKTDRYEGPRKLMVKTQLRARDISDPVILEIMSKVPRHLFVPKSLARQAYSDHPLPIAEGQTISQPYIVALMTQILKIQTGEKVLEVGTGSGYQAAVLAEITDQVYSIEIRPPLAQQAERFSKLYCKYR